MDIGKIEFGSETIQTSGFLGGGYNYHIGELPITVKIWNKGSQPNPEYAKVGDSGMDIRSDEDVELMPYETGRLIKTGIHVKIPDGYEIQVRPRSGQSKNTKMRVSNAPGTVDSGYTGEVCILTDNIGADRMSIKKGDRIAQIVLNKVPTIRWQTVDSEEELGNTERGATGFGSTGNN